MAILKREKDERVDPHVSEQTDEYFTVKKWLSKIVKVKDIDSKITWSIDSDCKLIYAYLFNFGKCHGWNSIYPNQSLMCRELGIQTKTLQRKLKILGLCGLIDIIKMRVEGENFYSNRYRVKRPSSVGRRLWLDFDGEELNGKAYKFNYSQFKKG